MGNGFIAIVIGAGAGGFTYQWFYKHTANTTNSAIGGGIIGFLVFLIALFALSLIPS